MTQLDLTLAEREETGGENGRTEETEEDGATDEFEASVFSLGTKPLTNLV